VKIRFVVDSGCDVPASYVKTHQMVVSPLYINYNNTSHADDGVSFDRVNYYEIIPDLDPFPQTSAPSVTDAENALQEALGRADHVIVVTIANKLSNTHNVLRLAASKLPEGTVTMWDSETLSMGGGWQAIIGAEVAEETGDLATVLDAMRRVRDNMMVYAAMETLVYLRKGGRIGWTQATMGSMLRIRPIVRVKHGEVAAVSRTRTQRAWIKDLVRLTQNEGLLERAALLHSHNLPAVSIYAEMLGDHLPSGHEVVMTSPVIGTHTGPNGIGIATVRKNWRD
jgi:DegV family protein with EDD domain